MNVRIKFLGGAKTVTGSKYLLEIDDFKLMIDCGLFQGKKELRRRNWDQFVMDPTSIDAIILTHAHIDHTGYLPKLFQQGYNGPVFCTEATDGLVRILLKDSAKLQEEEAEFARKKGYSRHERPEPLYGVKDAEKVFPALVNYHFDQEFTVSDRIRAMFRPAGHILGAAIVEVYLKGDQEDKKIVFSGDLGRYNDPILPDPAVIEEADILLIESTYGNKESPEVALKQELRDVLGRAYQTGGCVIVPAFSVGRTQTVMYWLWKLMEERIVPNFKVYLDSPMAISATELYRESNAYHRLLDFDLSDGHYVFDDEHFHYIQSREGSKQLNNLRNGAIIISASGMATGGRILHHLYHRLPNKNDTTLFVGYQAYGTRGRTIADGEDEVKIFGQYVPIKCRVEQIEGLSAHADRSELLRWAGGLKQRPKYTFVVHGEEDRAEALARELNSVFKWNTVVPNYLESFELFRSI